MDKEVEKLILDNTGLIYMVLKKYGLYNPKGIDKYYDAGMIGLVKGAISYKKEYGFQASTLLARCITNAILMECRKEKHDKDIISINTPVYENIMLEDIISSDYDLEKEVEANEEIKRVYLALKYLDKRERIVIIYSFGLYNKNKLNQKELAKLLNLSQAQISRIKLKSLNKLRRILNTKELK